MPNTGSISTLPLRLIWLVRSCRVGFTVVSTVPRGSSPGVVGFAADDVHPPSRAPAAATTPRRASLRLSNGFPPAVPGASDDRRSAPRTRPYKDHASPPSRETAHDTVRRPRRGGAPDEGG